MQEWETLSSERELRASTMTVLAAMTLPSACEPRSVAVTGDSGSAAVTSSMATLEQAFAPIDAALPPPISAPSAPPTSAQPSVSAPSEQSGGETDLVRRARVVFRETTDEAASAREGRRITREPTRAEVIESLGPSNWAILPGDKGEFAMQPGDGALELYWRNGACSPVSAMFDQSMHLIGDVDSAQCLGIDVNPGAQYACTKPDRARFCR